MSCDCKSATLPQMAGNLAAAAGRMVLGAVAGNPLFVGAEVRAARMVHCLACDQMRVSSDGTAHRCRHPDCGCWLDGKSLCKTCVATEFCPLGKWAAVTPEKP